MNDETPPSAISEPGRTPPRARGRRLDLRGSEARAPRGAREAPTAPALDENASETQAIGLQALSGARASSTMGALNRLRFGSWLVAGLVLILLASLWVMSDATENSAQFGQLYSLLLLVNAVGLITLGGLILWNLIRLIRQVAERQPGARLTAKMVTTFVALSVAPLLVVFLFSLQFLHRGIDSWFDVRIENALNDALALGQASLDGQMRDGLKQAEQLASDLSGARPETIPSRLNDALVQSGASELTLISARGSTVAASVDTTSLVPARPDDTILMQARQNRTYIGLDPIGDTGLFVRAVVRVPTVSPTEEERFVQALFPVNERMSTLADSVQTAFAKYRELVYLRRPLKITFTLTLSLVVLFSLMTAVWAAFFFARRMVDPIRDVAAATKAVAVGDYERQVPGGGSDELGFLTSSFNEMTRRLASARDETRQSQNQVEAQRTYLEAMLARLSSGVLTTDAAENLYVANNMAEEILGLNLETQLGQSLDALERVEPHLSPLIQVLKSHADDPAEDWREEVILAGPNGRQILMCRGTSLPSDIVDPDSGAQERSGQLIVFDDLTTLIDAQRNQAWSEVARRLAHEIKNPLTPIQLSAERLRHKYLAKMPAEESETLDRLTRTIVQQVESMKEMVNAFSNYARTPEQRPQSVDLNTLVSDVAELYRSGRASVTTALDPSPPFLHADPDRLRQVLHNLIKNAIEAAPPETETEIEIATRHLIDTRVPTVEVAITDNGTGIDEPLIERLFEPYVTTKPRGTGLGLAIVKKIVEEHSGRVWAENIPGAGARVVMRFPTIDVVDQDGHDREAEGLPLDAAQAGDRR